MGITLYEHPISPYARKVKMALFEKNVPFASEVVDLVGEEQKRPEFVQMNPFHKVPVLRVDGAVLFESTAINEYLEEKYPKPPLLPADLVLRAEARAWEEVGDAYFGQVLGGAVQQVVRRRGGPDPEALAALRAQALEYGRALDARLEGRDFVAGLFSFADIGLAIQISSLASLGVSLEGCANVARWLPTITGRESFKRAEPSPELLAQLVERVRAQST